MNKKLIIIFEWKTVYFKIKIEFVFVSVKIKFSELVSLIEVTPLKFEKEKTNFPFSRLRTWNEISENNY